MAFYKDREAYNQTISEEHYLVLHNQPVSDSDETPRRSFFRINDEEELLAASEHWIHFPCVVMVGLSGGLLNKNESIRQNNSNVVMFLEKIKLDQYNPIVAAAITEAYDRTFEVMKDFISRYLNDFEEDPGCGIFHDLDAGKFKWEQVGPLGDELYGWILTWTDEVKAAGITNYNPGHFTGLPLGNSVESEIIFFYSASEIIVTLTAARKKRFGDSPTVHVFINDGGTIYQNLAADITLDAEPPNTNAITVRIGGPGNGFIVLKK